MTRKNISARSNVKAALVVGAMVLAPAAHAETSSPTVSVEQPSFALLEMRRRFMDWPMNALTFQSIERIFPTQAVKAGARATSFQRNEQPLDFMYAFKGKTYKADENFERTSTNALLIIKNGTIVYERYRNLTTPQSRFLSMSVAKSMTSILVGIALDEGAIHSLDDQITAYVPELKGTAYDGVTLRNAIDMKSGVDRDDADQTKQGTLGAAMREEILVQNKRAATDEAFVVKRKATPGTVFEYCSLNSTILGWVLERATGQSVASYMSEKLWKPLGAESDAAWLVDGPTPKAHAFTGLGFNASLRDYARVGVMMLNGGRANGKQIVSKAWVEESVGGEHTPVAAGAPRGYSHAWWTYPNSKAYVAHGAQGQFIFVDPSTQTVVVKVSYMPLTSREGDEAESIAFMQAASQWKP